MKLARCLAALLSLMIIATCSQEVDSQKPPAEPSGEVSKVGETENALETDDPEPRPFSSQLVQQSDQPAIGSCTPSPRNERGYKTIRVWLTPAGIEINRCSNLSLIKQRSEGVIWKLDKPGLKVVFDKQVRVTCSSDNDPNNTAKSSECIVEPFCLVSEGDGPQAYKYTIKVPGHDDLDPIIIIDP